MTEFGAWRKSSRSTETSPNCVELAWRKSSYSTETGPDCVELAHRASQVAVRDSKNPTGPRLAFPAPALADLVRSLLAS